VVFGGTGLRAVPIGEAVRALSALPRMPRIGVLDRRTLDTTAPSQQAQGVVGTMRPELLTESDLPVPLGRYLLRSILGEGGMARVFRAELSGPSGFRKEVALKVVFATVASRDAVLRAALVDEARLGGLLHHPNIVDTYDFGVEDGQPWIAMELVEGVVLSDLLARVGAPPPGVALEIAV
jgi:hypothetical protein